MDETPGDRQIKVNGSIVHGSIVDVWRRPTTTSFVLERGAKRLRAMVTTPPTRLISSGIQLVVQGRLVPARAITIDDAQCAAAHDDGSASE